MKNCVAQISCRQGNLSDAFISGEKALLPEISRSAPMSSAACLSTSSFRLALKAYTDTRAAIPRIMEEIKSSNLDRLRRLSLQAILKSQFQFKFDDRDHELFFGRLFRLSYFYQVIMLLPLAVWIHLKSVFRLSF